MCKSPLVAALIALCSLGTAGLSLADTPKLLATQKSADHELWIVSTRHLGCPCSEGKAAAPVAGDFDVLRHDCETGWQAADLSQLLYDADPSLVTAVYVHGNRIEPDEVEAGAWQAFEGLTCGAGPRTRVVYWSWPSDKVPGQLRDVRYKMWRADCDAHYLASFLAQRQAAGRLVLVGYSFGARVVSGALQLQAEQGTPPDGFYGSPSVVLMAPAIERWSLARDGQFGLAGSQVAELLLLYNSRDPVLKRFGLTAPRCRPEALGYVGLCDLDIGGALVEQWDVRDLIGRVHQVRHYFESCEIRNLLLAQLAGIPPE